MQVFHIMIKGLVTKFIHLLKVVELGKFIVSNISVKLIRTIYSNSNGEKHGFVKNQIA